MDSEDLFLQEMPKKMPEFVDLTDDHDETSNGVWNPRPNIRRSKKLKPCACFSPGEEIMSYNDKRYWIVIQSNEKNTMNKILTDVKQCVPEKESVLFEFHCPTVVDE